MATTSSEVAAGRPPNALGEADSARARGRAYALLADLAARGPTADTVEGARASELLAEALDAYPNLDEAAADHQHVFGFSAPAFEGTFLDPDGVIGGALADRVHDTYRAVGYAPNATRDEAEHLATELRALAHLCAAEHDAIEDGLAGMVAHIRRLELRVLDGHLLRWLLTLAIVVRGAERPWPRALVDQIEDLVLLHRAALGELASEIDPFVLPPLPSMLEDEGVGLGDIARALTLPALAGTLLSRDDIAHLGRAHRVPRGFGERRVLLENLFRSSVELGSFADVVSDLIALLRERDAALAAERLVGVPGLAQVLAPLRARLGETITMLSRLEEAARSERANAAPS